MHEHYEYRRIRIAPRSWRAVVEHVRSPGRAAVEARGGSLFGFWRGQIGMAADEGVIISAWPGARELTEHGPAVVEDMTQLVESSAERLVATVRPTTPAPPTETGIYAHRWFDIQESSWPEFLELSDGAWPGFERSFDTRVVGFWRSLDVEAPRARVLLLTRYSSLAVWEESRSAPPAESGEGGFSDRFIRRHQLTDSTIVVTTQPIALG